MPWEPKLALQDFFQTGFAADPALGAYGGLPDPQSAERGYFLPILQSLDALTWSRRHGLEVFGVFTSVIWHLISFPCEKVSRPAILADAKG